MLLCAEPPPESTAKEAPVCTCVQVRDEDGMPLDLEQIDGRAAPMSFEASAELAVRVVLGALVCGAGA